MTDESAGYEDVTPQSLAAQGVRPNFVYSLSRSLPYTELDWEDFERLLARVARVAHGWRDVRIYGTRGQTQYGIDVVGVQPDRSRGCIQSKKYQEFTESDFEAAVDAFKPDRLPVEGIEHFVVATAVHTNRRQIVDALTARQDALSKAQAGYTLEFWDGSSLDDDLRNQAGLVTEFFGDSAAEQFCGYKAMIDSPPTRQRSVVAEAVRIGPNSDPQVTADLKKAEARSQAEDWEGAVDAYRSARTRLEELGFAAHARMWDAALQKAAVAAGDVSTATDLAAASFWMAVDMGEPADLALRELDAVVRSVPSTEFAGNEPVPVPTAVTDVVGLVLRLCKLAGQITGQVIGNIADVIDTDELVAAVDSAAQDPLTLKTAARLLVLAAQTSLASPMDDWASQNVAVLERTRDALTALESDELATALSRQLDVEIADAGNNWTRLLETARREFARTDRGSVRARAALADALRGDYESADGNWMDAIEDGCLEGANSDAAEWVNARRNLKAAAHAFDPMVIEDQRLAAALRDLGGGTRQLRIQQAANQTSGAMIDNRLRLAALRGRTYLRLAYAAGSWRQVEHAAGLLADIYERSDFRQQAVELLVGTGQAGAALKVIEAAGDEYLDATPFLDHPSPLVETAALKALGAQGDLLPDSLIRAVEDRAFAVVQGLATESDFTATSFELFLAALKALAGIAYRLSEQCAGELINILTPYVERDPNTGRRTDEAHVQILNGAAVIHQRVRGQAVKHLVSMLHDDSSAAQNVLRYAIAGLESGRAEALPALLAIEVPNRSENTAIGFISDRPAVDVSADELARARAHLLEASDLDASHATFGTSIVRDSMLVREDGVDDRRRMVAALIRRVQEEPEISSQNWPEYLVAALNLANDLGPVPELFACAMALAQRQPSQSDSGLFTDNPLAMLRSTGFERDPRPAAAALAAKLAGTDAERDLVTGLCRGMLPSVGPGAEHLMRAFEVLAGPQFVAELAARPEPELRALAARLWIEHGAVDTSIGTRLSKDVNPRVRNTLAASIGGVTRDGAVPAGAQEAMDNLRVDPRFSVRYRLRELP